MKKPDYIKIKLPISKECLTPAVKRYFMSLAGCVASLNYGKERHRKSFKYIIDNCKFNAGFYISGEPVPKTFIIELSKKIE
jgi:hypothetical protein